MQALGRGWVSNFAASTAARSDCGCCQQSSMQVTSYHGYVSACSICIGDIYSRYEISVLNGLGERVCCTTIYIYYAEL